MPVVKAQGNFDSLLILASDGIREDWHAFWNLHMVSAGRRHGSWDRRQSINSLSVIATSGSGTVLL